MWLGPPMVMLTSGLHPLWSYRRPLSFYFLEECAVGHLSDKSVAIKIDGEGNQVAVTEAGQVLITHVRIPLHDVFDATALRQRLYEG